MNIGPITIDQAVALAPMEDVTDLAYRTICKRLGADIVFTEFSHANAIVRDVPKIMKKMALSDEERPVGIQLYGGDEDTIGEAAAKAEAMGPDLIDINCGCWVKKVATRGDGAGLLRDLPRFKRIVQSVVKGTKLPVTVKTRLGWDEDSIVIEDVARMLEDIGVQALTIHCRTRSQAHNKAPADWRWLERVKKVVSIPIIGNGDVTGPETAKRMFETGCDGIMIGRAAIGNPWIFKRIKHYLATNEILPQPSLKERIEVCIEHLKLTVQDKDISGGLVPFRKFYSGYLKGVPNVAKLRSDLMSLVELDTVIDRLYQFLDEQKSLTPLS